MKADAQGLLAVATSIADGSEIDWSQIEAQVDTDRDRALLRSLRVIASIGDLHRSTDDEPEDPLVAALRGRIVGRIGPTTPPPTPAAGPAAAPAAAGPAAAGPAVGPSPSVISQETQDLTTGAAHPGKWGHLILRERVGAGVFGEVYRAYDEQLQREVALKLLRTGVRSTDRLAAKILHEGRLLARVRHPNVVTIHGVESHGDRVGLWMEFVRGATLEQLLQRQGLFGAREAALIGQDLCRALAAVHAADLIHRDVKAQNVMREEGGRLVLMDFGTGIPSRDDESAAPTPAAGTPLYLAPELLQGGEATVASDIYSLGVTLYHLVTGSYPVTAKSLNDLRSAHKKGRRRLHDARPDLPDAFVQVIECAITPNPAERFASAGAMQDALTRALAIEAPVVTERIAGEGFAGGAAARDTFVPSKARGLLAPPRPRLARWVWWVPAIVVLAGLAASGLWMWRRPTPLVGPINSIVVLSFANLSPSDKELADGISLLIGDRLAMLPRVRVIRYTPAMAMRDRGLSIHEILTRQQADAAVDGSVSWAGTRARVYAQIIRAGSDSPLWLQQFDVPVRRAPSLPGEVARQIAARLTPNAGDTGSAARPTDIEPAEPGAFESYLRGLVMLRAGTIPAVRQAVQHFQEALRRDPNHAPSWAALANCYILQATSQRVRPLAEGAALARENAERALQLDDQSADAYRVLAEVKFYVDWDWAGAEQAFRKAVELNPNSGDVRERYAMFLASRKRLPDAMQEMQQAVALDPMSSLANAALGMLWHYARSNDQAERIYRGVLERDPTTLEARFGLVRVLIDNKRFDEALTEISRLRVESNGELRPAHRAALGIVDAALGKTTEATQIAADLERQEQDGPSVDAASVYLAVGDRPRALDLIERAVSQRLPKVLFLRLDPRFEALHGDPRFSAALRQLGLAS